MSASMGDMSYEKAYSDGRLEGRMEAKNLGAAGPWIPVSERLPEREKWVLIHAKTGECFTTYGGLIIEDKGSYDFWAELHPPSTEHGPKLEDA